MGIDNITIKNLVGGDKISTTYTNINDNDNALYTALLQHIKGIEDKHNISDIVNDTNITGATIKEVIEYINNNFLSHVNGNTNRHKSSAIDDDSTLNTTTVKTALELLKSLLELHQNGTNGRHKSSEVIDDSTLNTTTVKTALELLKTLLESHENSNLAHNALSILFDSTIINEITAGNVQNAIEQLNARITNLVVSGGDSNPEIVDARNSAFWDTIFTTLKGRLDYTETVFDNRILPKNELITLNHNLEGYPQIMVLLVERGAGKGGAGEVIDDTGLTYLIRTKYISKNSIVVLVPDEINHTNPTLTQINDYKYIINFDDTERSVILILKN